MWGNSWCYRFITQTCLQLCMQRVCSQNISINLWWRRWCLHHCLWRALHSTSWLSPKEWFIYTQRSHLSGGNHIQSLLQMRRQNTVDRAHLAKACPSRGNIGLGASFWLLGIARLTISPTPVIRHLEPHFVLWPQEGTGYWRGLHVSPRVTYFLHQPFHKM